MRLVTKLSVVLATVFLFLTLLGNAAEGQDGIHEIFGRVTDQAGDPIEGTIVEIIDPGTNTVLAFTTTESEGDYSISIETGTYHIRVIPPAGSGLGSAIALNQAIDSITEIDFVLVSQGSVILSGVLTDPLGNPIPNQEMELTAAGTNDLIYHYTDTDGYYSFEVAPGEYRLRVEMNGNSEPNAPRYYVISNHDNFNLSLTESTVMDIELPVKQVTVHVQDPAGNPVSGVGIGTNDPWCPSLTLGVLPAEGYSGYPPHTAVTDASGTTTLWLFPTYSTGTYTFTAIPPEESPFATTSLGGVAFTTDTEVTITLATPVTLSGYLTDPLGNAIPNQEMELTAAGTNDLIYHYTDTDGYYSYEVAPGEYWLRIRASDNTESNAPSYYFIYNHDNFNLSLTESTVMDIELPVKQVTVHVQDPAGNPVSGVGIGTNDPWCPSLTLGVLPAEGYSGYPPHTAVTDASGTTTLWLFPTYSTGTYTFTAIPPEESPFATTSLGGVAFTTDTEVTITLATPVTLSGYLTDPLGNAIPNQEMELTAAGTNDLIYHYTDTDGYYSYEVAPGEYWLRIRASDNTESNAPSYYFIYNHDNFNLSLTESTVMDIELPVKQVTVHVQDPAGNPVSGVGIGTNDPWCPSLTLGVLPAEGYSGYPPHTAVTDASGTTTLWLFPTYSTGTYTFTAIPPEESPFATFNVHDITITNDKTIIMVLQFVHPQPVTTATIVDTPYPNGEYPDPTTVILSATAAPGYAVDGTYYSLDGEADEFYNGPFEVAGSGGHSIEFWSIDNAGVYEAPKWLNFTVITNLPPVADAGGPYSVDEGGSVVLAGSGSDPDGDLLLLEWDLDADGQFDDATGISPDFSAAGMDGDSNLSISLRVTDPGSLSDIADATVNIANVSPAISAVSGPVDPLELGSVAAFSADFTDPGVPDTFTALVDWGDGETTTIELPAGSTQLNETHTYGQAGIFGITVTVSDDDGGQDSAVHEYAVVFDPDGGFVTGGGWIDSPAGAYVADPSLTGKANFGFVSKYKKGASIPTGQTEFKFSAGDLNFHSSSYQWLVVAGPRAQFKGAGTINGQGDYGFLLTGIDSDIPGGGDDDRFRIKIWDRSADDAVVYDNKVGETDDSNAATILGGGSIVIHKK